jgi:8-oxo-dGTP pyrophosphatase MutT (NUDIX family)
MMGVVSTAMSEVMPEHFVLLSNALRAYAQFYPAHRPLAEQFLDFAGSAPQVFERTHRVGHFTGSAWLVSADGRRVLLTHHRKLDRWLQLGGHADGDQDLAAVALREAQEESGLPQLCLEAGIFDLDRHLIPARGNEPTHWHYDVRYVVRALGSEAFVCNEESLALAWRSIEAIVADPQADESLRRMALRWSTRDD